MTTVSLEDIMNFMKKEKEERAKERESDKEEIKHKIVDGVKDEVKKNIKPIQDRQDTLEQAQVEMKGQFAEMLEEVKGLRTGRSRQDPLPSWPSSPSQSDLIGTSTRVGGPNNLDPKGAEVIEIARRTVGLHKIVKDDLARMRLEHHGGATTEKEEKILAVK